MKIASWNVNSIKARLGHVEDWLKENEPDLLLLQELKGTDFPADHFEKLGYQSEAVFQKAYNGVAILSKEKQDVIGNSLHAEEGAEEQARYLEIDYKGVRVINIYLPNGNPAGTEKYAYKINWMEKLVERLTQLRDARIPFLIGGDFNIIPEDKDCYSPAAWEGDALFLPQTRSYWRRMINLGLADAFRAIDPHGGEYTFWDYQAGAWPQNKGIRIDHFLLSPAIADRLAHCHIDKTPRAREKASDHTPIVLQLQTE
jgi:exodeoxyribonuclease-3